MPDDSPQPPGPRLPAVLQTLLFGLRTVPFMTACRRRFGDVFTVSIVRMGSSAWVTDPRVIKEVYSRDRDNRVPEATAPSLEPMFGLRSVFLAEGAAHRRKRSLLMPPFHGERLATWRERMDAAAEREIDGWPAGGELKVAPRMRAVTEEVIFEVVFGLGAGRRHAELREALTAMVDAAMRPAGVLLGFIDRESRFRRMPGTPWGRLQRRIDVTHELLEAEIRRRREDPGLGGREDVFSLLLQATDEDGAPMCDEELRDELISLLLAGAESSATTLAWAVDFLLHEPDALARLRDELERGHEAYLEAVLQETMRLRPVPHMTGRRLTAPLEVGGFTLEAGATVAIPAYLVHHRPDVYPEPGAFRPQRFLERRPDAFAWLPFGGGARRCVGASFATLEMKAVLSTVVTRVSMRPLRRRTEKVRMRNIILTPAGGTRVLVDRVEGRAGARPAAPARQPVTGLRALRTRL